MSSRSAAIAAAALLPALAPPPSRAADDSVAALAGDPSGPPEVVLSDDNLELVLYAEHPDIVTPTGLAIDPDGALYVAETHTHFRPEDYTGPAGDRILRLTGSTDDGRAENIDVFYEGGLSATMDIEWGLDGDWLYIAERSAIFRVRDSNGDGTADLREDIIILETEGSYPHNGLSGLSFDGAGFLVFGLGENLGKPYQMIASDGAVISGGGEGGSIWSCEADGAELRREATGLWNPFGTTIDLRGNVFCIDNDPGERPPNRLINVVWGGDYGFKYRYGRSGLHPFQCWDGELPGTLPMVTGVGEASCAVMAIGDLVLGADYAGKLLVTSWADHRLELYTLQPRGGSFGATREIVAQGDMGFRPVAIVPGHNGEVFISDWAFGSYEAHGHGRIWKLAPKSALSAPADGEDALSRIPIPPLEKVMQRARDDFDTMSFGALMALATSDDPFACHTGLQALGARIAKGIEFPDDGILEAEQRVALIHAARRASFESPIGLMRTMLKDSSNDVRFEALRWIADTDATELRPEVEIGLEDMRINHRLFTAYFATLAALDGEPDRGIKDYSGMWEMVENEDLADRTRALALRSLPEGYSKLSTARLASLVWKSTADEVRTEALAHLGALVGDSKAQAVLWAAACDPNLHRQQRADALSMIHPTTPLRDDVEELIEEMGSIRTEAERLLRRIDGTRRAGGALPDPDNIEGWISRIDALLSPPDVAAGRRLFFNRSLSMCANCHQYSGRGRRVGPDLTHIAKRADREWLLRSLLQPSAEISPTYLPWTITTTEGESHVGYALRLGGQKEVYMGVDGAEFALKKGEIASKAETDYSMMPPGIPQMLTAEELRNLIAFLLWQREK